MKLLNFFDEERGDLINFGELHLNFQRDLDKRTDPRSS